MLPPLLGAAAEASDPSMTLDLDILLLRVRRRSFDSVRTGVILASLCCCGDNGSGGTLGVVGVVGVAVVVVESVLGFRGDCMLLLLSPDIFLCVSDDDDVDDEATTTTARSAFLDDGDVLASPVTGDPIVPDDGDDDADDDVVVVTETDAGRTEEEEDDEEDAATVRTLGVVRWRKYSARFFSSSARASATLRSFAAISAAYPASALTVSWSIVAAAVIVFAFVLESACSTASSRPRSSLLFLLRSPSSSLRSSAISASFSRSSPAISPTLFPQYSSSSASPVMALL